MATYSGNASYFYDCPVGHDCCDGFNDIAYGHLWTDQSCGVLPQRGCDEYLANMKDLFTGKDIDWVPISTQCSCRADLGTCSGQTRCNGSVDGSSAPILDLTDDLFLYFHGSLSDGRVRFSVTT